MRILMSSSTIDVKNGYGNITYELVRSLKTIGHKVTLLLPEDDSNTEYDIDGVNIERILPPYTYRAKSRLLPKYLGWNYQDSKRHDFDLAHSLFAFPYAPLMCREAKRLGLQFIVGAQGTYGVQPLAQWPEKHLMNYAYSNAAAIIVPSVYTREAILRESGKDHKISIIHNGVNYKRFAYHSNKARKDLGLKERKVLLTVGELKNRKGQDLVIRALPNIVKKHPDVLYVMVGRPSWKEHLVSLANQLNVQDHVKVTGTVSDDLLLDYFHQCNIYVHTARVHSRFQFEGFGIVYLEAGACGKPSVGTDSGGIRDALIHNMTGLVAEDGNVEQIAIYINKLLDDPSLSDEFGRNAYRYAEKHKWENIAKEYSNIYNRIVSDIK